MTNKFYHDVQSCNRYLGKSPYEHDIKFLTQNTLLVAVDSILKTQYQNIISNVEDFERNIFDPIYEQFRPMAWLLHGYGNKKPEKRLLFTHFFNHTVKLLREGWILGKEIGHSIDANDIPWDGVRRLKGLADMGFNIAKGIKTMEEKYSFERNIFSPVGSLSLQALHSITQPGFEPLPYGQYVQ